MPALKSRLMSCSCHVAGPKSTCQARLDAPGPGAGAGPVHNPTGSGVFAGAERQHPAGPASPDPEQPGQTARRSRCGQTPARLMAAGQARDMRAPPGGVPSQDVATDSSLPSCPGQASQAWHQLSAWPGLRFPVDGSKRGLPGPGCPGAGGEVPLHQNPGQTGQFLPHGPLPMPEGWTLQGPWPTEVPTSPARGSCCPK